MKKRRRITANLNEKIHLGPERDASDQILVVDCEQEVITKSELASTDQLECTEEVPQSPEQRKLFSSLQYNKNLLKYLNDDRQKHPSFCDLLIIVEGKEFSAHKVVVAVGSSYFHACLSKNPSTDVVTLDHVTHSVFQHLLEFLYTSEFFVYKNEIPLVLEAAKFLDIIDAVKLLNNEDVTPIQSEVITEAPIPAETLNDLTSKLSNSHLCTFCGRNFCYKKSLENHLAKAHRSFSLEKKHGLKMVERADFSTRRSTRNRKCPAKFDNSDNESGDVSDSNFDKVSSDKETSDKNEFDDSGSEYNVDEAQEEEMSGEDSEAEEQSEKEHGAEESPETVDSVGSIPEGLAPVMIQSSSKKLLQCPKCDKTFDRTGKYESHTRVHTGEKPFECDICHQHYSTKSNLTVHRKKHNSNTEFHKKEHKCPYCNKLHASKKTLAKHVKRFHPENIQEFLSIKKTKSEGWKCDICKKSFARRLHLEEHMILHSQDKPFKCTYCEEHFKSRFARLKHQEKFHLGPFPCDICGREFNDTGNLKRHIECTHGGKRKWTCFICGKSVRERTTLKEHLRIHSGEKPHLCSICGQSFRHGSSYRLHLRVHHDDKRYECEECGKTFIRHDHLTKHKKIHSGEKAHQCEECGKCFGRRDHLTVHYKSVHLGEKVWQKYKATFHQCEVCKKIFKGKSSLEMHFRTHSGEKPYKCQICNQSFRIKKTLTKHMVIHSDARPFNCQHCNATFKRKDKLKYHIDHVHGTKGAEETLTTTSEEKLVSLPVQYPPDEKVYETEAKQYIEQPKVYQTEAKTMLQNVSAEVCVPVTLVPVPMPEPQGDLVQHTATLASQSHGILPPQTQQSDYQRATDLAFLEKYTLTPQPANIVHPVRPEQMLDPRDQSYLGTLLGLDTAPTVQNISNEHS
ncbi:PREDICTED: zinc finger and BTB domain-containing protein 41 [Gavialis gangeticus]|uniref:zinc finger and BTB domain-containing protein 41 n=1 Tax=Gavialis gangeticus TaxID=94835 RepID=UPI00092E66A3|nr:PREDICTED: zinc finger and BTB domain-containing protein 41 [Gavialis gangeticus]XP_019357580.1 PREDICTED: zinc finger and BTB domain-containing protein 41 [Gavialis gangeticus]XP_019357581.1 PREDICTED: zinc finger and BTB domain-containing protein 41 [Gavialis gangeticus]